MFYYTNFFVPALFWPFFKIWWIKKGPEPKKLLKQKIIFFMPVNYTKEFLNSLHTSIVFSELFSRASNGRQYSRSWNFQLNISLCSVFQHAEFKFHGCSWIWDFQVCVTPQPILVPLSHPIFSPNSSHLWIRTCHLQVMNQACYHWAMPTAQEICSNSR